MNDEKTEALDPPLKTAVVLSFEGGLLTINLAGYGEQNGSGRLSFKEEDLDWGHGEDMDWRSIRLPKSELEELRNFLNERLPPADAQKMMPADLGLHEFQCQVGKGDPPMDCIHPDCACGTVRFTPDSYWYWDRKYGEFL